MVFRFDAASRISIIECGAQTLVWYGHSIFVGI